MSDRTSSTVQTAKNYYNSHDADNFYFEIWGGEDIHIGLYQSDSDAIADASRRTVQTMARLTTLLGPQTRVLDIGSGFGGAARYLAGRFGCHVTALNLSEVENERNRDLCRRAGLSHRVEVVDGNFEDLPFDSQAFHLVWSQDAFLHSGHRERVIAEAARVMKPDAELIFTDPMQSDACPQERLQPILDRIHLEELGSPAAYRELAKQQGLRELDFVEQTDQLVIHYQRVLQETESRQPELRRVVSPAYLDRMKRGLQHWIEGGQRGDLAWGIFRFAK